MIRTCFALLAAAALTACSPSGAPPSPTATPSVAATILGPSPAPDAVETGIAELAQAYQFTPAGEAEPACMIRLDPQAHPGDDGKDIRPAWISPDCYQPFPPLRKLATWKATGGATIELVDTDGGVIGTFSPVQDDSGVYLRGGAGGKLYEMRMPGE